MFGFGRSSKDPLSDVRSAERWLSTLPGDDPLAVHSDVIAQLDRVAGPTTTRTPNGLRAVFHVDAQTGGQRRALIAQYIEHANRSSKIENQLWTALFGLTQGFLATYQSFAREIADHPQSTRWQELLPELVCRQIVHLALDARVRLFRYEQWIPAKWAELHALMTLACSRQVERHVVTLADTSTTTIEHEYLRALVLQLMNAGNLTARQVELIWGELDDWCAPLRLTLEPSAANAFFVDLAGREGLRRRTPGPLEGRVLFLDTRPLHAVLMQHVVTLEQKIKGEPLSNRTPRRSEQLTLLHQARRAGRPRIQAVRAARRAHRGERKRRRDRRLPEDRQLLQGRGAAADRARRFHGRQLRQHDGDRRVRPHPQRADAAPGNRAPAHRRARGAGRAVGSEGRLADRLQADRADRGRQRGHARHAGRDPSARPAALDARHHPPHEAHDGRSRRDRPADRRRHAFRPST